MSELKVVINNIPRPLFPLKALPKKIRKDFDYVKKWDDTPRFVEYQGEWYDAIDTQGIRSARQSSWGAWGGVTVWILITRLPSGTPL